MKRIGILTSGGDAPGMNAAIRGAVRTAISMGVQAVGFKHGYSGLIQGDGIPLDSRSVGGIVTRGGTILRSARCLEFRERAGREKAMKVLESFGVEGLVVIGGDGSLTGARQLALDFGFPVVGVPGSIDNDLACTDTSIGFDTALNIALEAIDRLRDTAYSHDRVFVVEVMGRHNGFIAVDAAIAGGAEAVIIPEIPHNLAAIAAGLRRGAETGKRSSIIVVAEGAASAQEVREYLQSTAGLEVRFTVLGHVQRGGSPTAFDRILALQLSSAAVKLLLEGATSVMTGFAGGKVVSATIDEVLDSPKPIDPDKLALIEAMDR